MDFSTLQPTAPSRSQSITSLITAEMQAKLLSALSILGLPSLITAECQIGSTLIDSEKQIETREGLCKPQGGRNLDLRAPNQRGRRAHFRRRGHVVGSNRQRGLHYLRPHLHPAGRLRTARGV
ncbi:hypothetical protein BJY04DRAFT_203634 [Aspergillus karnatakaensis]|uniref:uncharacterized protein n=1 Tax=Aspergillus karnatakaensis TaxID=1810916 RepID=UPI003CCDE0E7